MSRVEGSREASREGRAERSRGTSRRSPRASVAVCAACALAVGCTWVALTPSGEQVQVASQQAIVDCKQLGKTIARTKSRIWLFGRSESKVREELRSLARNDAARMGGTTVSPLEPMADGIQMYGIYVCTGG
jgi:hypothetical protein